MVEGVLEMTSFGEETIGYFADLILVVGVTTRLRLFVVLRTGLPVACARRPAGVSRWG